MSNNLLIAVNIIILLVFSGCTGQSGEGGKMVIPPDKITDTSCDALNPCPQGLECYKFPEYQNPVCAERNPCSYVECPKGMDCAEMESYPSQPVCIKR